MNKFFLIAVTLCAAFLALPLEARTKRPKDMSKAERAEWVQEEKEMIDEVVSEAEEQLLTATAVLKKIKSKSSIEKGMKELQQKFNFTDSLYWTPEWNTEIFSENDETNKYLQKRSRKMLKLKNALAVEVARVCALDPERGMDGEDPNFGSILRAADPYALENYTCDGEEGKIVRIPNAAIPTKNDKNTKSPKKPTQKNVVEDDEDDDADDSRPRIIHVNRHGADDDDDDEEEDVDDSRPRIIHVNHHGADDDDDDDEEDVDDSRPRIIHVNRHGTDDEDDDADDDFGKPIKRTPQKRPVGKKGLTPRRK